MDLREAPQKLERRHPWEVARAKFMVEVLSKRNLLARPLRVLDAGAGDGYAANGIASALPAGSSVVCFDPEYSDQHLRELSTAAHPAVSFTRDAPSGQYDLLLVLDVLEHVRDDRAFLAGLVSGHLADEGLALITVPAWNRLFTRHDVFLHHQRRYRPAELGAVLAQAGLRPVIWGGLFHGPLFVRLAQKIEEVCRGVDSRPAADEPNDQTPRGIGDWTHGPFLTAVAEKLLLVDNRLSLALAERRLPVPGLSIWALCAKS
jgi:SAM-dependent methyltransferase